MLPEVRPSWAFPTALPLVLTSEAACPSSPRVSPLLQAVTVEGMIAQDGQDAVHRLVHALQAYVAGG